MSPRAAAKSPFPRGRVTGGSSAVNTTIALRSTPEDHAEWAAAGNPEWAWDRILPAYRRLERDLDFPDAPHHGDAGPISIRRYRSDELLPQHQAFFDTAAELGYAWCADANAPDSTGASPHPLNKLGRLRVSCAIGYLAAARARPNLTVSPDTFVRRLVIERDRCVGVEIESTDGTVERPSRKTGRTVCRRHHVTGSAAAFRNLDPRRDLEALGIGCTSDVPGVGRNLSDHPALSVVCNVKNPGIIDFDQPLMQTILRYTAEGSDKRNDLQIEQLSFVGRPGWPAQFAIAAVLEYQYGRGELRLRDSRSAQHHR